MGLIEWDAQGVWLPTADGQREQAAVGPIAEVAHVPGHCLVFQRRQREPVIWAATPSGPQELIVAAEDQSLTLEGAALTASGEPLVFYQRHETGAPEETRSTLRTYNVDTDQVTEITRTGEWEAGTDFDHLSSAVTALAHWWSGASAGNVVVDLSSSSNLTIEPGSGCFDGEPGCVVYEHATIVDGRGIGVRPIWNEDMGWFDQLGVFEFDLEGATEQLISAFPWDNGTWYVEDMFELAGDTVVLSLADSPGPDGRPLPALVVSIDSGTAFTLPDASFVRPFHQS